MNLEIASTRVSVAGQGDAVVLLHCLGSDLDFWREPVESLSERFKTVRYDFPGHGRTPVAKMDYVIADLGDHCVALLRSLGISRAHVAGISLGGLVALDVAARWPSLVTTLVVVDATAKYSPQMAEALARRAALAQSDGMPAIVEETLKMWLTPEAIAANSPAVLYARRILSETPVQGYVGAVRALCRADLSQALSQIRCPTLIVCGDQDAAFVEPSAELSRRIQRARMHWLSPAKHASALEHGTAFAEVVEKFFAKVESIDTSRG